MWLMGQLVPDHNTISNFRKDNEKAIRQVFRHTVSIAKAFNLIGGKLIAGDSTKLRAQNSKKNNFNENKIARHLVYIENKLDGYNAAFDKADEENKKIIQQQIDKQNSRKEKYNTLSTQLLETGETQISISDPDSRQMITRNNITEIAYNVQTTVDDKHCLTLDYKVTNENDSKAMGTMLRRAQTILQKKEFTALYDKSYHTGSEIERGTERQWGYYFISTKKGIKHASADVGLMFTALNLRRLMNIIDKNALKKFLSELVHLIFNNIRFTKIKLSQKEPLHFWPSLNVAFYNPSLKGR